MNVEECNLHQVIIGINCSETNTTCYHISNASLYGGYDGPSFLDRLDGRYNLSEIYVNQSLAYFNNSDIGIETLVNLYELDAYGVNPRLNASWIDYLYWQSEDACQIQSVCPGQGFIIRLDDPHAEYFAVNTECMNTSICPNDAENCVDCVDNDFDLIPDWLDSDCSSLLDQCGQITPCDEGDDCSVCDNPVPPLIDDNSSLSCAYYGMNATEWHFYKYVPDISGMLTIEFDGNANVNGPRKTDLVVYNYTIDGDTCQNSLRSADIEDSSTLNLCVQAQRAYMISLDVDSDDCTDLGNYTLKTWLSVDPTCPSVSTTSSTIATSTSVTSSTVMTSSTVVTSSTIAPMGPCGFYDDFEDLGFTNGEWTHGDLYDAGDEWAAGNPDYHDCYSVDNCFGTDITGTLGGGQRYDDRKDQYLKTPQIDLTSATSPNLRLQIKYNTEQCCDFGLLQASTNNIDWSTLDTDYGSNWSGNWFGWHEDGADLSAYTGQQIWLRILFETDNNIRREGIYIDNFNVSCG